LGVSHGLHRNDLLVDKNLDLNRDHRKNDRLGDHSMDGSHVNRNYAPHDLTTDASLWIRNCALLDRKTVESSDVNHGRRNCVLDDRNLDDDLHGLNLVVNHVNCSCVRHDLKMGGTTDVSLCLRMNDLLDDLNLDVMMDANRDHHMNDLLDGHSKDDDRHDSLVDHRMNATDDLNDLNLDVMMDVSHVNRNCARRDLKMDVNLVVKNLHVKLMVYLSMSCDRMSHDHLRYDRQMMRHRDTNRMAEMNLDGKILVGKILVGKLKNSGAMNSDARMI
jgi:hypothetical protein